MNRRGFLAALGLAPILAKLGWPGGEAAAPAVIDGDETASRATLLGSWSGHVWNVESYRVYNPNDYPVTVKLKDLIEARVGPRSELVWTFDPPASTPQSS